MISGLINRATLYLKCVTHNLNLNLKSVKVRNFHYKPKDGPSGTDKIHENLLNQDLILFKCEEPRKILWRNVGALIMCPLWIYLGYFALGTPKIIKPMEYDLREHFPSQSYAIDNIYRFSRFVGFAYMFFGFAIMAYWLSRTAHTVRRLILRKGGKHVTLISYGLTGYNSVTTTVRVADITPYRRHFQRNQRMFLKVKDKFFKYQLNVQDGTFTNRQLFEKTVGVARRL